MVEGRYGNLLRARVSGRSLGGSASCRSGRRIEREVWSAGRNWCSFGRARTYAFWYRIRETLQAIGSLRAKRPSGTRLEARSPFDALVEAGAEGRRIQLSKPPFVVPSPATCFRQRERKSGYAILRGKLT